MQKRQTQWNEFAHFEKTISQQLQGLKNLPYIADTWNFVFEMAPSADNCIVGPDYSTEAYF